MLKLTIPNYLTLFRIALIPVFVVAFYLPIESNRQIATFVFGLAGFTDWLDGYLARRWNQESPFGAFLDPVADKLIVVAALVLILQHDPHILISLAVIIIISREVAVSALREWMAEIGQQATVKVSMLGKVKTTAQLGAIGFLTYHEPLLGMPVYEIGLTLLTLAVILTIWSMVIYIRAALSTAMAD